MPREFIFNGHAYVRDEEYVAPMSNVESPERAVDDERVPPTKITEEERNTRIYDMHRERLAKRVVRQEDEVEEGEEETAKRQCVRKEGAEEEVEAEEEVFFQPRPIGGLLDSDWGLEVESAVLSEKDHVRVMEQSQKDILSLMRPGEEVNPRSCFACMFMHNESSIYKKDWDAVVTYFETALTMGVNYRDLGESLYAIFEQTVVATLKSNEAIDRGCTYWSPYGILYHFLNHHNDLKQHMRHNFLRANAVVHSILRNGTYTVNPASGREVIHEKSLKTLMMAAQISLLFFKAYQSSSSSSTSTLPTVDSLNKAKQVYMPPAKTLTSKPNFAPTHTQFHI